MIEQLVSLQTNYERATLASSYNTPTYLRSVQLNADIYLPSNLQLPSGWHVGSVYNTSYLDFKVLGSGFNLAYEITELT